MSGSSIRTYQKEESVVFCKTTEAYGGLSNMAAGYPIDILGHRIRNTEALYQACRFPDFPDIQLRIVEQSSPMAAKMVSRENDINTRQDWNSVRFAIMKWCISVKLIQNWDKFSTLLRETGTRPIVEFSMKDDTWGAMPSVNNTLVGVNALGRLLMKIREDYVLSGNKPDCIPPLQIPNFRLFGEPIGLIYGDEKFPDSLFTD